ncbi:MAG: elongation factor P [Armatimonadetes bacterium]|nr:elongation factor P [Armatimonadota bacterium]
MAIDTSDFKNGITIVIDGEVWRIIDFQHVKPGKGGAFVRSKLQAVKSGKTIDKTFRAGEKMEQAILERRTMQYLFASGDTYTFMDMETFEQTELTKDIIGDQTQWLMDGIDVMICWWGEKIMGVDLPNTIDVEVVDTDPGLRGDTASGGSKPCRVASGATVTVPLFINVGDKIKVDTRSGEYIERAKS